MGSANKPLSWQNILGVVFPEGVVNFVEDVGAVVAGLVEGTVVGTVGAVVGAVVGTVGAVVGAVVGTVGTVVGAVVGTVGIVEGVVKGAGVVGMTIGPFIASIMVLINENGFPSHVPWKSSVSIDQTMAPPKFM